MNKSILATTLLMVGYLWVHGQTQTYNVVSGTPPTPNQRIAYTNPYYPYDPLICLTWGGCDWSTNNKYTYIQHNTGKSSATVTDGYQYSSLSNALTALDGYSDYFQGLYNPKDELGYNWGFGPDEQDVPYETYYNYSATTRLPRFNVPARGSFFKFEPYRDGQLTVYIFQNGCLNYNSNTFKNTTFSYRPVFIVDEHGEAVTLQAIQNTAKVRQSATSMSITGNLFEQVYYQWLQNYWYSHGNGTSCSFLVLNNPDLSNIDIDNPQNDPNRGRTVKELNFTPGSTKAENIFLLDAGIAKYTFNVKAGKTYFVFALRTKSGLCGFNFIPSGVSGGTVTLSESDTYSPTQKSDVTVVLKNRSLKAGVWQPICLPFSVNAQQVKDIFGEGTEIAHFDNTVNNRLKLKKHIYHYIIAGVPCFVKSKKAFTNSDITFPHVTIETTAPEDVLESYTPERIKGQDIPDYKLVGTFSNTMMDQGDYYIGTNDGETAFFRVNSTAKAIKAFRCYITPVSGEASAKVLEEMIFDDPILAEMQLMESTILTGIATGLNEVEAPIATPSRGVYNIGGQRMHEDAHLPAGIYIINGKKTIIE